MPAGYGGFIWGDRWYALQNTTATNNYLAVGSGLSITIRRADGTAFYFDGADFWSRRGLDAVGDFYFVLYYQGQTVYNGLTAKKGKQVFTTNCVSCHRADGGGMIGPNLTDEFWIHGGTPNRPPVHVAFRVGRRDLVDAFHRAALAAGEPVTDATRAFRTSWLGAK